MDWLLPTPIHDFWWLGEKRREIVKKKSFLCSIATLFAILTLLPSGAYAEEASTSESNGKTYRSDEKGKITLKYFDDNKYKEPVVGSKWRLYKVGDITYTNADETVDGLTITSLIDGLEITSNTTSDDVAKKIDYKVVTNSKIEASGKDINGKELKYVDAITGKDGTIVWDNLEQGVYLGIEMDAIDYHNRSTEFLISIPNTDSEGKVSSLEATIEPKAVLAGNIKVSKMVHGNNVETTRPWTITLSLPSGRFYYESNKGQKGYIEDKGTVRIVHGETVTIYDVPAGSQYMVEEAEANTMGYSTTYDNQKGRMECKKDTIVSVHNTRNKDSEDVRTGTGEQTMIYAGVGIAAVALLAIVVVLKKKKK